MSIGKNHALKKYDQFALHTSCFGGSTESNIAVVISPYSQNCGSGGGGVIPGRDGNVFLLSILNLLILKIQSVSHYYFIFLNLNFFPN